MTFAVAGGVRAGNRTRSISLTVTPCQQHHEHDTNKHKKITNAPAHTD